MTNKNSARFCKNRFFIKDFRASDGRRFALLLDRATGGFPAVYPTAYTTQAIPSLAVTTQRGHLYVIKKILEWEHIENINVEYLLASKKGFSPSQMGRLSEYLESNQASEGKIVNNRSFNNSLDVTNKYFIWLHGKITTDSNAQAHREFINSLTNQILTLKKRNGSRAAYEQGILKKKLSEPTRDALLEIFKSEKNEEMTAFQQGIAFRNMLCLWILYDTGMRKGELLSLTLNNFIPATGGDHAYIQIERNQDDEYDLRVNQPVVKTEGRSIAISPELEKAVLTYIGDWRAQIDNVEFEGHSPLFVTHKNGESQGQGIQITSFSSTLKTIIQKDRRLIGLRPHLLRHDWNYRFSKHCTNNKKPPERERDERGYLMGWVPGSNMNNIYDRRFIQEEAYKAGLAIASGTTNRSRNRKT